MKVMDLNALAYFWKKCKETFVLRSEVAAMSFSSECPHCGAPFGESDYCDYCKSYIGMYKIVYDAIKQEEKNEREHEYN